MANYDIPSLEREEKMRLVSKHPNWTEERIQEEVDEIIDYVMENGKLPRR